MISFNYLISILISFIQLSNVLQIEHGFIYAFFWGGGGGGGGGDVEESSVPARCFVIRAIADFIYLESKVFSINTESGNVNVEFKLSELPNDMKMLCFLAGAAAAVSSSASVAAVSSSAAAAVSSSAAAVSSSAAAVSSSTVAAAVFSSAAAVSTPCRRLCHHHHRRFSLLTHLMILIPLTLRTCFFWLSQNHNLCPPNGC